MSLSSIGPGPLLEATRLIVVLSQLQQGQKPTTRTGVSAAGAIESFILRPRMSRSFPTPRSFPKPRSFPTSRPSDLCALSTLRGIPSSSMPVNIRPRTREHGQGARPLRLRKRNNHAPAPTSAAIPTVSYKMGWLRNRTTVGNSVYYPG